MDTHCNFVAYMYNNACNAACMCSVVAVLWQGGGNPEVMGMGSLQEAGYPRRVSWEKNFLQHYAHTGGNHYGRGWEP